MDTHTDDLHRISFKKPGARQPQAGVPGLKINIYMDVNVVIFVLKHVYVLNVYLSDKSYIKLTCIYIVFAELHQLQLTYALLSFLH